MTNREILFFINEKFFSNTADVKTLQRQYGNFRYTLLLNYYLDNAANGSVHFIIKLIFYIFVRFKKK